MSSSTNYQKWQEIKNILCKKYNVKPIGNFLFSVNNKTIYIYTKQDITIFVLHSILNKLKKQKGFKMPLYIITDKKIDKNCYYYCNLFAKKEKKDLKIIHINNLNMIDDEI